MYVYNEDFMLEFTELIDKFLIIYLEKSNYIKSKLYHFGLKFYGLKDKGIRGDRSATFFVMSLL